MKVYIEFRWPDWARWRRVPAAPHSNRWPLDDNNNLCFPSIAEAEKACASLSRWNSGSFRIES